MSDQHLDGKVVLITGAGSGIGRALAIEFASRNARVVLVGRREQALSETLTMLPNPAQGVVMVADITNPVSRANLVERLRDLGHLDILVNNAGTVVAGPLTEAEPGAYRQMIETNLLAPMELTMALLPLLRMAWEGRVVNVGSMFGDIAFPYFCAYSASKFGLRGWSEALRRELEPLGVGVTYAAPRGTRTPAADGFADIANAFKMVLDPPEKVARQIVTAVAKGARDIYPRGPERLFVLLQRLLPGVIDRALVGQSAKAAAILASRQT